ncbi:MAG TPA: hypothetical protein VGJ73_01360 [Verrucomicrobiae bacterium]|jgi:hypothetical protein
MKNKTCHQLERGTIVNISSGQYELVGGSPEELVAAEQWAAFWGHQIVPRSKCRRPLIPPASRFRRTIRFLCLKSRGKF